MKEARIGIVGPAVRPAIPAIEKAVQPVMKRVDVGDVAERGISPVVIFEAPTRPIRPVIDIPNF